MWTVPLTEFQQEFLRNCDHRWNIKTGATRSGKTYLDCAVTIPKRICAARNEGLLVMLGNTLGTLERNVLEPMRSIWGPDLVGIVPRRQATSYSCSAARYTYWVPTTRNTSPAFRVLPLSMPTGTRSPHGTRACSRCSKAACPARTAILTAPATRTIRSTGSRSFWTATPTFTVRPILSTITPPCRRSLWLT